MIDIYGYKKVVSFLGCFLNAYFLSPSIIFEYVVILINHP